ncbi:hypothetical protein [Paraconexibacter sp. AEG42_29]|uniref:beta-propeller domain-containing protein n=1 Tax=Paraconexibacter sp. AEG42_29 TaxID=2997339 RepID=UPI00339D58D3
MTAVLGAAAAAPAADAAATGPTAIGQDSQGVSYVGFATGTTLMRIDASGAVLPSIPLDQPGPVDGISVDPSNNVWVDYGGSVSQLTSAGAVVSHFDHAVAPSCPDDAAHDPARYGGIAVTASTVFVAGRCNNAIEVYSRTGALQKTVTLPSGGFPRGIAYGVAQNGQPAKLYVALPDQGKVVTYNADTLASGSQPIHTLTPATPGGGSTPAPGGVFTDIYGQLIVTDMANNAVYFYDTNNNYSFYRTLGHPPGASSTLGSLSNPSALAVHAQDGTALANNLFIADTGNQRVQRWDSGGYTYWGTAAVASANPPAAAPTNLTKPGITGTPAVGQTLTCGNGTWSGSPTSYTRTWNRDGTPISGATATTYAVVAADAGKQITCAVKAINASGTSAASVSDPVTVAAAASAPANTAAPTITGTATTGQTVTCQPGTWTGSPTYAYRFLRGTTQVGTSSTYVITAADVGQALTCVVTATNAGGSTSATSAPVTPTAAVACPGRVGVSINGGASFTANQAVTLTIKPPAGATSVLIANDGGFGTATTQALAGNCAYTWTLAVSGTERLPKTVYVRFAGSGFDNNQTFTDDIVLDKTAPSLATSRVSRSVATSGAKLRALPAAAKARKAAWVLAVKAKDNSSGVAKVQYASKRGAKGRTVAYRARLTVSSPTAARWVRVIDRAGNPSRWVRSR